MISDEDKGYKAILEELTKGRRPFLRVGIFGANASLPSQSNGSVTVLDVATWNEFGTETVPERSFIRGWCDENEQAVLERLREDMKRMAQGKLKGEQVMNRLGLFCVGGIQQRISDGIPPPNAESTIRRKGSSTPLIDTGQMRSSITYTLGDDGD